MKNYFKIKQILSLIFLFGFIFVACSSPGSITDPCEGGHTWGAYVQTTAPNCENPGIMTRACTISGCSVVDSVTEVGDAPLGHLADGGYDADCENEGNSGSGVCTRDDCDETDVTGETIPARGHNFSGPWQKDPSQHWKVCLHDDCDALSGDGINAGSKANHIFVNDECTVCDVLLVHAQVPNITVQPQGRTYDRNATGTVLSVTASVTDGGTLSYQWFRNTVNSTEEATLLGTSAPTPSTANAGTFYYFVVVTNTNNDINGTKTVTATSNIIAITVNKTQVLQSYLEQHSFVYTGNQIIVKFLNPDSSFSLAGTYQATNVGSYSAYATLNDKNNYEWYDGTTEDKLLVWFINEPKAFINDVLEDMTVVLNGASAASSTFTNLDSWWGLYDMLEIFSIFNEIVEDTHYYGQTTVDVYGYDITLGMDIKVQLYESRVDIFARITMTVFGQVQETKLLLVSAHRGQGNEKWYVHLCDLTRRRDDFDHLGEEYFGTFFNEQRFTYNTNSAVNLVNRGMSTDISIDTPLNVNNVTISNLEFGSRITNTSTAPYNIFNQEYLATFPAFEGHPVNRQFTTQERQAHFDHLM